MDFREERGIGYCGLACMLCSYDDNCPGCKERIAAGLACSTGKCAANMMVAGCHYCPEYDTCGESMPHGKRSRAFNRYAREFGVEALIDRLRINYENGITYHMPDKTPGDYDKLETEEEIYQLLRCGRADPYANCPIYESIHFQLRLVSMDDAEALLPCYSQPTDSVITNSFNCTYGYGSQTIEEMRDFIRRWLEAYLDRGFIRWSVVDKSTNMAIGTIELFNRQAADYFNNCGILRLDLSGGYEYTALIGEILSLLLANAFVLFGCTMIATKTALTAKERMAALDELGFHPIDEQVAGGYGVNYDGFWILERKNFNG